ncbi:MAG: glycosyltransferase [Paramuribaculum sp.]|nr:glycosyltransferase [Paramuribaculum sp.]
MPQSAPLISVAVIFRNARATLPETLQSLGENAGSGREFLFIDDGSTDGSARLVEEFIKAHPDACRLITLPVGVGTAEATAIAFREARGEYLMRCDADDTLEPGALDTIAETASRTGADLIAVPLLYDIRRPDGHRKQHIAAVSSLDLNDMPIDTVHFGLPNKLIRRSLVIARDAMPFPGIDRWEDLGVVARVLARKPTTAIIGRPLYRYIRRVGVTTLSSADTEQILRDHIALAKRLDEWFTTHGLAKEYEPFLLQLKFLAKVKLLRHRPRRLRQWQRTFPEVNSRIMQLRHIPLRYRLLFAAATHL